MIQLASGARKIPRLWLALVLVHCFTAGDVLAQVQRRDTASLLRQARRAELEYESGIRRYAPVRPTITSGRSCDENVGRYCVIYDTGAEDLPPEPKKVRSARDSAISALLRADSAMPGSRRVAYPLVRFLVVAGRAGEAVDAARAYARVSTGPETYMLLGYALHAARHTSEALAEFERWLATLTPREREHVKDVGWLLSYSERRRLARMTPQAQDAYRAAAWRFADPLYLTDGNEMLAEHYARFALTRMLAARPPIAVNESYGSDIEQLTVRFGPTVRTTKSYTSGSFASPPGYSESWDPALRTYFPPDPRATRVEARLDTIWPVDSLTRFSGHAPPTIRIMRPLEHQAAVLSGDRLVVLGSVRLDSVAAGKAHPYGRLFALDSAFEIVASEEARVAATGDSATFRGELVLPSNARFYSAELLDSTTLLAARARFPITPEQRMPPLTISGLLLSRPFEAGDLPTSLADARLEPLARPVLRTRGQFGVYGELLSSADRRKTIRIELETRSLDRRGALAKLGGWIGSKIGLSSSGKSAKLSWSVDVDPGRASPLALTIDAGSIPAGRYEVVVRAHDTTSSALVAAERKFLVVD